MIRPGQLLGDFTEQFLGIFQSLLIGTEFRLYTKHLMNLFMTTVINFRSLLKKILVFLQMLIFYPGSFKSVFINGVNQDLCLTVKRTRMEWGTMSTPNLVNLANQLSHTLAVTSKKDHQSF